MAPLTVSLISGLWHALQTALRTELPAEFLEDMRERHPSVVAHLPLKPMVFDVFSSWRLDSGSYADMAEVIMSAWEHRCTNLTAGDVKPPRPKLMHSNLSNVEEVAEVCRCTSDSFRAHTIHTLPFACCSMSDCACSTF